jgi:type I restriction enzyme M protein
MGKHERSPWTARERTLVVSKIFDNEDFGFNKITVERPLRLNFQATDERIALLDEQSGFKNLAASNKKNEELRQKEIEAGQKRQDDDPRVIESLWQAERSETL